MERVTSLGRVADDTQTPAPAPAPDADPQLQARRRPDHLTEYAEGVVSAVIGASRAITVTIPHGLDGRFLMEPRPQRTIAEYSQEKPLKLLYVSIIDAYKHQWKVVEAVHSLRATGLSLRLHLVGPAYEPALRHLEATMTRLSATLNIDPAAALMDRAYLLDLAMEHALIERIPKRRAKRLLRQVQRRLVHAAFA